MRISETFQLGKSQAELDFVDIDPDEDFRLFVDPYFLAARTDAWSVSATRTVRDFFQHVVTLIRAGNHTVARQLFLHLSEPNETCLGLSRGRPSGRGIGAVEADSIFNSLMNSRAVQTGIVDHLEDCRLFVDGIDKDKTSDMTTNIIRHHLIEYTIDQCRLWGIPTQRDVPTGFWWDRNRSQWINTYSEMLIVQMRKILLVPKAVVSYSDRYIPQRYYQHYILNFLQNEHLEMNSALVQQKVRRDGTVRRFVTKRSLKETVAPYSKEFLTSFTQRHPEVFRDFRQHAGANDSVLPNEALSPADVKEIARFLSQQLPAIPAGNEAATRYHRTVAGILELLFYPNLVCPQIEQEIHQGRKRIDITFDNAAEHGFFFRLHTTHQIPCQYVFIECKNYSREVANPELDQMAGRFSPNRGRFGIIVCRDIADRDLFLTRCRDTYDDGRGLIVPFTDRDLIDVLVRFAEGHSRPEEELLAERMRQIFLG